MSNINEMKASVFSLSFFTCFEINIKEELVDLIFLLNYLLKQKSISLISVCKINMNLRYFSSLLLSSPKPCVTNERERQ